MKPTIITRLSYEECVSAKIRVCAIAVALGLVVVVTSSCGTARGFGQDVEKTGDKIQEAAAR